MYVPPLYPATALLSGPDLDKTNSCLCGRTVRIGDVNLCWTHRVGDEDFNWFCVCSQKCYTMRVCAGDTQ